MRDYDLEALTHDAIHGYIPFTSTVTGSGETCERQIIDNPWVQRLRHIHQLQTAWWVYPTAEHTRFQHVLGVMHLASRATAALYESLKESHSEVPSRGYVETLLRMAGLLHDVGHGPFGHFFDQHFLSRYSLTHEKLGAQIIEHHLGEMLAKLRRNPYSELAADEQLQPRHVAWLIQRPTGKDDSQPRWLHCLRGLLAGIYTIDNMDFVLRDAYMSGYSQRAFDLDRLLHYSFFSEQGLTVHDRGVEALVRFMGVRAELFRTIYFHRTVRAIDLTLADLFADGGEFLFPGNPVEHLDEYLNFTESSLLVDVGRWRTSQDTARAELGERWAQLLRRELRWKMIAQRSRVFAEGDQEGLSILSDERIVADRVRSELPSDLRALPLRIDIARHIHRPHTSGPAGGQNFLFDSARGVIRPLTTHELFRQLPVSHRICRVYAQSDEYAAEIAKALDIVMRGQGGDDVTNM